MVAETSHKDGERGALRAKQWLESTTHVAIPFTVYDDARQTTVVGLDQKLKRYDLAGHFLGENRRPLFVEVKSYNATGSQGPDYMEFLANAYSATALQKKQGNDQGREFMWLTTHPFSLNKWVKLSSPDEIRDALKEHDSVLAGEEIDEGLLTEVSKRLWLVLLHERQYELVLSREELYKVYGALGRKGF